MWYPGFTNGANTKVPGHLAEFLIREEDEIEPLFLVEVKTFHEGQAPETLEKDLPLAGKWGKFQPTLLSNDSNAMSTLKKELNVKVGPGADRFVKHTMLDNASDFKNPKGHSYKQEVVQVWSLSNDAEKKYMDLGGGSNANTKCFGAKYDKGVGDSAEFIAYHGAAVEYLAHMVENECKHSSNKSAWVAETGVFKEMVAGGNGLVDKKQQQIDGSKETFQTTSFKTNDFQFVTLGGGKTKSHFVSNDAAKVNQYLTPYQKSTTLGANEWMLRVASGNEPALGKSTESGKSVPRQFMLVVRTKMTNFVTLLAGQQELQGPRIPIEWWAAACRKEANK